MIYYLRATSDWSLSLVSMYVSIKYMVRITAVVQIIKFFVPATEIKYIKIHICDTHVMILNHNTYRSELQYTVVHTVIWEQ